MSKSKASLAIKVLLSFERDDSSTTTKAPTQKRILFLWVQKLTQNVFFFLPFFHKTPTQNYIIAEMSKWRTLTFLAVPACCAFGVYTFASAEHGHGEEQPAYSYLKRRSREQWPWGGDLGLFEYPKGDH